MYFTEAKFARMAKIVISSFFIHVDALLLSGPNYRMNQKSASNRWQFEFTATHNANEYFLSGSYGAIQSFQLGSGSGTEAFGIEEITDCGDEFPSNAWTPAPGCQIKIYSSTNQQNVLGIQSNQLKYVSASSGLPMIWSYELQYGTKTLFLTAQGTQYTLVQESDGLVHVEWHAVQATAAGDPHLKSLCGHHFDINKEGIFALLEVPKDASEKDILMKINAKVEKDSQCQYWISHLTLIGQWVPTGRYDVNATRGVHLNLVYGPAQIHIRSKSNIGNVEYYHLNLQVGNLAVANLELGGLLGECKVPPLLEAEPCVPKILRPSVSLNRRELLFSPSPMVCASAEAISEQTVEGDEIMCD